MVQNSHAPEAPTGRRRRKTARPAEIVSAATATFIEHGYAGTKLDAVAKRAGIAKGTIYLYFDTKQDLFEAVIRQEVESTIGDVEAMIAAFDGPSDMLLRQVIGHAYQDLVLSDTRYLMRIIIGEGHHFPEIRRLYYENTIMRATVMLKHILQRGVDRGEFRDSPIMNHPTMMMSPCFLAAIWSITFAEFAPLDIDSFMASHVDVMLNGIVEHPPAS